MKGKNLPQIHHCLPSSPQFNLALWYEESPRGRICAGCKEYRRMGESLLRTQPQYEVKLKSCQFTEHPARDDLCFSFFLRLLFFHWIIFRRKEKRGEKKKVGLKLWNKTNAKSDDCPWVRWNEMWNVLFLYCMYFTHYFCIFISHITPTCMSSSLDDMMSPTDAHLLSSQTSNCEQFSATGILCSLISNLI